MYTSLQNFTLSDGVILVVHVQAKNKVVTTLQS